MEREKIIISTNQLLKLPLMENIFLLDAVISTQINNLLTGIVITFVARSLMLGCSLLRRPSHPGFLKMSLRGWFWGGSEVLTP